MTTSYAQGDTSVPMIETTIGQSLVGAAAEQPDRDALVVPHQQVRWSYAELLRRSDEIARGLLTRGFAAGDRIGIWAPNCSEWVLVQLATARIGVILVNINPAYRTHEVKYALEQSGCRGLVAATVFKTSDYVAMIDEVRGDLPELDQVIYIGTETWDELVADGASTSQADLEDRAAGLSADDPINIQYTSGTTGFPKGATLTHRNILNNGYFVGRACGYTEEDRVCIPVPLYHCFGMVMGNLACIAHRATMVLPAPSFEPGATLDAVENERCTSLYGVPTMFIAALAELENRTADLSSLRTGIMAGSPCPIEVMKQTMNQMGIGEITIAYGMTETSPVSTQTDRDDPIDMRVSTVGRVQPHVEIKIVDPDTGDIVERGEPGEFCTRGYSVMTGYWNDPERTAAAVDGDGWMHTGDLATMDADGYVNIVGRIKDMVIRGGENVYPREIEEFLYGHPRISDVQVVGVPDEKYGEELLACITTTDGEEISRDEVAEFCQGKIAHYKIPRHVLTVTEFPMTVTGKIQKFALRDLGIEKLGLEDAAGIETA